MKISNLINIHCFSLVITLIFTQNAYAYLDPGTGSILIQGLIAAIAGGLFTLRMYWQRIKNFFSKGSNIAQEDSSTDDKSNIDSIDNEKAND